MNDDRDDPWEFLRLAEKKRKTRQKVAEWFVFLALLFFVIACGFLFVSSLSGCKSSNPASNENRTTPEVGKEITGSENTVTSEITSNTDQKALSGEVATGDVAGNSSVTNQKFDLSPELAKLLVIAASMVLGLVLFGYCVSLLVTISLVTPSDWAVFAVGVGGLIIAVWSGILATY